ATHLELPQDIAGDDTDAKLIPASHSRRPLAEHKAIEHAASAIRDAKRPLLMVGAGANRKTTARMLAAFVDKLGIPFFSTQMGKGVIDETGPLWMGTAALSDHDFVHRAIDQADCIINIGHDVIEKPPFFMREGRRTVIHVNYSGSVVDPVYFPQVEVVGDIANAVWQLAEALEPQEHWDFGCFDRRSEEHTSELQSRENLVCRLLLELPAHLRALHPFPTRRSSDLEAAGLHARGPAHGDPRQLLRRGGGPGVLPAGGSGGRHRQRRVAAGRGAGAAGALGPRLLRPRPRGAPGATARPRRRRPLPHGQPAPGRGHGARARPG